MPLSDLSTSDTFDETIFSDQQAKPSQTETIDLDPLLGELNSSGTFDFKEIGTTALGKLLQALPIPSLLVGPLETIIFANQTWEQISPTYQKILYRPFHELFPDPSLSRTVRSMVQRVFETRSSQLARGSLAIDREQIWGRIHLKPLRIGDNRAILVLVEDLTAEKQQLLLHQAHQAKLQEEIAVRKTAEASMRASEQRMRVLLQMSPIGVGIVQNGSCVYANRAFRKVFAYENGDSVLGQPVENFIDPDHRQLMQLSTENEDIDGTAVTTFEGKGIKKNGKKFDITIWQRRILYLGESALIIFVADVSEAKTLRSQLLQAQKMEAVGTLAGGIAHDFNNLLTVIQGFAELIALRNGKNLVPHIQKILEASRKGKDMVQHLLAFSRKVDFKLTPIDLNHEVEQFETLLQRTIPKMIHIDLGLAEDLPTISGDRTQIEQILMNLALNASDAMPDGGKLCIKTRNIGPADDLCQRVGNKGSWVLLSVSDTGCGIKQEIIDHIFEPFFTTKDTGKGTGLGLATVYGIVKQHNAHIGCDSEPGKGTTFHVYFPVTDHPEGARQNTAPDRVLPGGTETILLVDDEDMVRCLAEEFLGEVGYTVLTASDGKMALEVYQRDAEKISLVILDLIMPRMSGRQCLEKLLEINPEVKVIVASGYAGGDEMQELVKSGARGFVKKPYELTEMLRGIRAALDTTADSSIAFAAGESPFLPKRKVDALEVLLDLRDGLSRAQILTKYGLSSRGLQSLLTKLQGVRERYGISDAVLMGLRSTGCYGNLNDLHLKEKSCLDASNQLQPSDVSVACSKESAAMARCQRWAKSEAAPHGPSVPQMRLSENICSQD